jgi:hypothetical protein
LSSSVHPIIETSTDTVTATFIENWTAALRELSIPSLGFPLRRKEAQTLGRSIVEWGETFDEVEDSAAIRRSLIERLDQLVGHFPGGAFVRLGSRSPKDAFFPSPHYRPENGKIVKGRDAWNILTAGSERMSDDLHTALVKNYQPWIWVREGQDIPRWSEFRCFMRDRKLVGISQYFYGGIFFQITDNAQLIRDAIIDFFAKQFVEVCHLDSVFDVFLSLNSEGIFSVRLLEINPFNSLLTDPCMFKWDDLLNARDGFFKFRSL